MIYHHGEKISNPFLLCKNCWFYSKIMRYCKRS